MSEAAPVQHDGPVAEGRVNLLVELVAGSEPIEGWLTDSGGTRRQFAGWIDLVSVLEEQRDPRSSRPGGED